MNYPIDRSRAGVSALLAVLVVATALVPPFLDRDDGVRVTLESTHDPTHCARTHDHRVCAQIDGSPGLVAAPESDASAAFDRPDARLRGLTLGHALAEFGQPPSRAPPSERVVYVRQA